MMNYSKRNRIILSLIISIVICISLNFIIRFVQKNQKKEVNSSFILKTSQSNPIYESTINPQKEEKEEIKTEEIEEVIKNQYQSNHWRIFISKIYLDAPILEGTSQEVLRRGVGHFESTSKWEGNVCLAAHNRGYKYNYFQEIKRLEKGDIIKYQTEQGIKIYEVNWIGKIKETDVSYLKNTKENQITLVTCLENMPEYRLCVQAKELKN